MASSMGRIMADAFAVREAVGFRMHSSGAAIDRLRSGTRLTMGLEVEQRNRELCKFQRQIPENRYSTMVCGHRSSIHIPVGSAQASA
jgi:hypothetical protein